MAYEVSFDHDFEIADERWSFELVADVHSERFVERVSALVDDAKVPLRLTAEQFGVVERRAIEVFDEMGGAW